MMRVARVASFVIVGFLVMAARSQAQTPAPAASAPKFFAAFDAAATFGHKSSGGFGGEAGMNIWGPLGASIEGGQMKNVGTQELDARALIIANAVGATASASYRVNYFDIAARYTPKMKMKMNFKGQPYAMFGVGLAEVRAETALAVNGTTVTPESLGVAFGTDLNGTVRKALIVVGGGLTYPVTPRVFVDGSFRYGRILAKTNETENDTGINTARAQVGIGIVF